MSLMKVNLQARKAVCGCSSLTCVMDLTIMISGNRQIRGPIPTHPNLLEISFGGCPKLAVIICDHLGCAVLPSDSFA